MHLTEMQDLRLWVQCSCRQFFKPGLQKSHQDTLSLGKNNLQKPKTFHYVYGGAPIKVLRAH